MKPTQTQIDAALKAYHTTKADDPEQAMRAALTAVAEVRTADLRPSVDSLLHQFQDELTSNQRACLADQLCRLTAAAEVGHFTVQTPTWDELSEAPLTPHGTALVAATIERCAQVCERFEHNHPRQIAAAIRALNKENKNG